MTKTGFVVLIRNPTNNEIYAIVEDQDESTWPGPKIMEFKSESEAFELANKHRGVIAGWPFCIVESPIAR